MNKKDTQNINVKNMLSFILESLEKINSKLNLLIVNTESNFKDDKHYYIKVTKEYLNEVKNDKLDTYPYTLDSNIDNNNVKTRFTIKEIEMLKQDKRLNWLNWDTVTLEEV